MSMPFPSGIKAECQRCKRRGAVEIHHVIPRSDGGSDDRTNLCPLCESCHKEWHRAEYLDRAYNLEWFAVWLETPPLWFYHYMQRLMFEIGNYRKLPTKLNALHVFNSSWKRLRTRTENENRVKDVEFRREEYWSRATDVVLDIGPKGGFYGLSYSHPDSGPVYTVSKKAAETKIAHFNRLGIPIVVQQKGA